MKLRFKGTRTELTVLENTPRLRNGAEIRSLEVQTGDEIKVDAEVGEVLLHDEPHHWEAIGSAFAPPPLED